MFGLSDIEIRLFYELADVGDAVTPQSVAPNEPVREKPQIG
jgi:hypothetical protein